MAHWKVLTHHLLIAVGGIAFFTACSGVAYKAAGAAVSLGSYAMVTR